MKWKWTNKDGIINMLDHLLSGKYNNHQYIPNGYVELGWNHELNALVLGLRGVFVFNNIPNIQQTRIRRTVDTQLSAKILKK
jgi:hypothetical protein